MSENPVKLVSTIREFNELHDFANDPQLDRALTLVVNLMLKPEVPSNKAPALINELQALSTAFAVKAVMYATIGAGPARSPEAHKKNVYFSMKEALNKLVDALKYTAKSGMDY